MSVACCMYSGHVQQTAITRGKLKQGALPECCVGAKHPDLSHSGQPRTLRRYGHGKESIFTD